MVSAGELTISLSATDETKGAFTGAVGNLKSLESATGKSELAFMKNMMAMRGLVGGFSTFSSGLKTLGVENTALAGAVDNVSGVMQVLIGPVQSAYSALKIYRGFAMLAATQNYMTAASFTTLTVAAGPIVIALGVAAVAWNYFSNVQVDNTAKTKEAESAATEYIATLKESLTTLTGLELAEKAVVAAKVSAVQVTTQEVWVGKLDTMSKLGLISANYGVAFSYGSMRDALQRLIDKQRTANAATQAQADAEFKLEYATEKLQNATEKYASSIKNTVSAQRTFIDLTREKEVGGVLALTSAQLSLDEARESAAKTLAENTKTSLEGRRAILSVAEAEYALGSEQIRQQRVAEDVVTATSDLKTAMQEQTTASSALSKAQIAYNVALGETMKYSEILVPQLDIQAKGYDAITTAIKAAFAAEKERAGQVAAAITTGGGAPAVGTTTGAAYTPSYSAASAMVIQRMTQEAGGSYTFSSAQLSALSVKKYQHGGFASSPQVAVVGEVPEWIIPESKMGGFGAKNVYITQHITVQSDRQARILRLNPNALAY